MKKLTTLLLAAATSLGLAFASTAMAQKEPPKDAKAAAAAKADATKKADAATKKAAEPAKEAAKPAGEPMDINSASETELASLKGIGDVRAKAIVKGRPYKGKDDLLRKKIVPKNVYEDIKDQIIAKQDTAAKPAAKKSEPAKKTDEKKKS
jgi:DNA uptake protein ComE-like DNA-binding protein